jgi:pimeloyl-ACP methyl ester carboxylesterase
MKKLILFLAVITTLMTALSADAATSKKTKVAIKTVPVSFLTPDWFQIKGDFFPATPDAPVVLLLHQLGTNRSEFIGLAKALQSSGINALAYDARGHGESVLKDGKKVTYETFTDKDFENTTVDMDSAIKFLRDKKKITAKSPVGIVGASIQSSTGLVYASEHPDVKAVVLLSPGLDYHGIDTKGPMARYGNRPVYIAASIDDAPSYKAAKELEAIATGAKKKEILSDGGHGATMFRKDPGLQDRVAAWLKGSLK